MARPQSTRKWKQVLGFDDGIPLKGNPQSKLESPQIFQLFQSSQNQPSYPQIPKDITIFKSNRDIIICPSTPANSSNEEKPLPTPPPLFYITVQNAYQLPQSTGRPDLILHSGPSKASAIVSFAKFHPENQETDITLCPPPRKPVSANFSGFSMPRSTTSTSSSSSISSTASTWSKAEIDKPGFRYEKVSHTGGRFKANKHSFCHTIPQTSARERFEWRYTSRLLPRHAEADREAGGMKLIRTSSGETVAVYVGLGQMSLESNPSQVMGMFRFLRSEACADLEDDFEWLAIMSILSIVERNRRVVLSKNGLFELY